MKSSKYNQEIIHSTWGFAIGDALGEPFEFQSPSQSEIEKRFYTQETLAFTDDTKLFLSSLHAYRMSPKNTNYFWPLIKKHTISYLVQWYESGDLRGIGHTTYAAIKQMVRTSAEEFSRPSNRGYDYSISAGNGILSRSLPLIVLGQDVDDDFVNWMQLTHLHEDGHQAVKNLEKFIRQGIKPASTSKGDETGSYAPDALMIAVESVADSATAFEVFKKTQRPKGDNDSTAALGLGLWALKNGLCTDLKRLIKLLQKKDLAEIEVLSTK